MYAERRRGTLSIRARHQERRCGSSRQFVEAVVLFLYDRIAFAHRLLQARPIEHSNASARVLDDSGRVQLACRCRNTYSMDTQHVRDQLLRHAQLIRLQAIKAQQQPSAQLLIETVMSIANSSLRHLRDQRLRKAQ